ncbi:MAG: hypothetical protein SNJ64_01015 [Endomicrobiia bacterium]
MQKFRAFVLFIFVVIKVFSYERVDGILHIHSNCTDEKNLSIEEIVKKCKNNGITAISLNDHCLLKAECGLWPLNRIIKQTCERKSVLNITPEKYLDEINNVSQKYPDMIIIPGVEVTPSYYWTYKNKKLVLNNFHKHMLVCGLLSPKDFYNLPVIGNENNSGKFDLLLLWPLVAICFILVLVKTKIKIFLIIFLSIILINNYPFRRLSFDAYKNYGELPYQELIDYVNNLNKEDSKVLITWAHPDAPNWTEEKCLMDGKFIKVFTKTEKYSQSLLLTKNYDGFAIFAEGYKESGKVGGVWDKVLLEYCLGEREKPVWCFAEVDYSENSDDLYVRKNILFVEKSDYVSVMNAYKKGRFYALWRNVEKEMELHSFSFYSRTQSAKFGEEIIFDGSAVTLSGKIKFSDNSQQRIKINIIRDGEIIKFIETLTPYELNFTDMPNFDNKKKVFYRIFIESNYPHMIATNPVFIVKN